jgi:hypothetical protein
MIWDGMKIRDKGELERALVESLIFFRACRKALTLLGSGDGKA